jgi:hypothetical protein
MVILQMPMAAALPSPPYAAGVRASGWRFILDMERIEQSTTWLVTPLHLRPWLLMLWAKSWQQIPCGSLPNDIENIAALVGLPLEQFEIDRVVLMRKWYLCCDGRWYHPFITKQVVEMLDARKVAAERKDNWRKRQREYAAALHDPSDSVETPSLSGETLRGGTRDKPDVTRDKPDVTRENVDVPATSSSSSYRNNLSTGCMSPPNSTATPDLLGDHHEPEHVLLECPHAEIVALWAELLPALPQPIAWRGQRVRHLRQRWRELAVEKHWKTRDDGLAYFAKLFRFVGRSKFLTGRVKQRDDRPPFVAELSWLVRPENFLKVSEGRYTE